MNEKFVGGLLVPWTVKFSPPWICLIPAKERLEFKIRFGLGRFAGPWILERPQIAKIYKKRRGPLTPWPSLGILGEEGLFWTFRTFKPEEVLRCLEGLGYPVDYDFRG